MYSIMHFLKEYTYSKLYKFRNKDIYLLQDRNVAVIKMNYNTGLYSEK